MLLEAGDDATVTVHHGARALPGLGRLMDGGDRGDTDDVPVRARIQDTLVRQGAARAQLRLQAAMDLPRSLAPDRSHRSTQLVPVPIEITVTAWHDVPGLTWHVRLDNLVEDHRLRLHLPAAEPATTWVADGSFSLITRPTRCESGELPSESGFEAFSGAAPVQSVAAIGRGTMRIAVLCAGLPKCRAWTTGPMVHLNWL